MKKVNLILQAFFIVFLLTSCQNSEVSSDNYYQIVNNLGWYESQNPTQFLEAEGNYGKNFWGDKIKISAEITNKAKVASFKDIILKVKFYSKTESIIGTKEYTVYEIVPAQKIIKVDLEIENYENVETLSLEIMDASLNSVL